MEIEDGAKTSVALATLARTARMAVTCTWAKHCPGDWASQRRRNVQRSTSNIQRPMKRDSTTVVSETTAGPRRRPPFLQSGGYLPVAPSGGRHARPAIAESETQNDDELLDSYSRTIAAVVNRVAPTVVNIRVLSGERGQGAVRGSSSREMDSS